MHNERDWSGYDHRRCDIHGHFLYYRRFKSSISAVHTDGGAVVEVINPVIWTGSCSHNNILPLIRKKIDGDPKAEHMKP